MAEQSCLFAAVAGYVGRPEASGAVGVFRLANASDGRWQHVLESPEAHYVMVHPADPDLVFAGTDDGVYRSTDRERRHGCTRSAGPGPGTPWV